MIGVQIQTRDGSSGRQHIVWRFAGQAEDHVDADVQLALPRAAIGIEEGVEMMAAAQPVERAIVNALQPIFDHQPRPLGQAGQQVEHLFAGAVGTGADDHADHLRMRNGLLKGRTQPVDGAVGIRARLEVGEEALGPMATGDAANPLVELVGDSRQMKAASRAETFGIAEDTTQAGQRAVAVRAGAAGIEAYLPNPAAELLGVEEVEAMVREAGQAPVGGRGSGQPAVG